MNRGAHAASILDRIRTVIGEVIRGKREAIDRLLVAVLSEGHVLGEETWKLIDAWLVR